MWKRILAYSLFILGFLTITFFRKYTGTLIPYPFLFWVVGLVFLGSGFLFLRLTPSSKELAIQKQVKQLIDDLKLNGEKIKVPFHACEIKENSYTEERSRYGHENEMFTLDIEREIEAWNAIGNSMNNVEQVRIEQSVIIFKYDNSRTGKTEQFISRIINKDKVTLSYYLDQQKHTALYVNKTNRLRYYFDLDFLT